MSHDEETYPRGPSAAELKAGRVTPSAVPRPPLPGEWDAEAGSPQAQARRRLQGNPTDDAYSAGYSNGYRVGLTHAGTLQVAPGDVLVINLGPNPAAHEVEAWREQLTEHMPELDGRVLLTAAESLAVIRATDLADSDRVRPPYASALSVAALMREARATVALDRDQTHVLDEEQEAPDDRPE